MYVFEFVGMRTASRGRVQRGVVQRSTLPKCIGGSLSSVTRAITHHPSTPTECRACVNDWVRVGMPVTVGGGALSQMRLGQGRRLCVHLLHINSEERDQEPHRQSPEFMYLRGALLSSARSDCEV